MSTPAELQRKLERLEQQLKEKDAALEQQDVMLAELKQKSDAQQLEIGILLKQLLGRKSERYLENPAQLKLDFGDGDQIDDAVEGLQQAVAESDREVTVPAHKRRTKKRRNEQLPGNLPRHEVTVELPAADQQCDQHGPKSLIGYDTTETLEYTRPQLRVRVTRYPKYACSQGSECGVAQPERLRGLVEGNRYDSSIGAEIAAAKYGYHLPVYRQQDLFAGCGWTPSRSTLLNVLKSVSAVIQPFARYLADAVREDSVVGTDDTGVKLIIPKTIPAIDPNDAASQRVHEVFAQAIAEQKSVVNAKLWAYRGVSVPLNVFDFSVSRHRDGPDRFLIDQGYQGILLGDCYSGYTGISLRSEMAIEHAACVSHARRKVFDARLTHPAHASRLLAMFQELYDIEDEGKDDLQLLSQLRAERSREVWSRMRDYLNNSMSSMLPKEPLSQAAGYLRNQWDALTRYVDDLRIPIDNNLTEQLMKQVAIGRKNWMFIGSVAAGHRAADLMTLVSSAIRNDLDVFAYLKGVIDALLAGAIDYSKLRPDVWAQTHPDQIRQYRVEERRDRADRKQRRRTARRHAARGPR